MKKNNLKTNNNFLFKNKFFIISSCFFIWMIFFDTNSLFIHYKLYKENEKIQEKIIYLKSQINIEKDWIEKEKSDPDYIEKFAREKFYMKRPQEDIFIVPNKKYLR